MCELGDICVVTPFDFFCVFFVVSYIYNVVVGATNERSGLIGNQGLYRIFAFIVVVIFVVFFSHCHIYKNVGFFVSLLMLFCIVAAAALLFQFLILRVFLIVVVVDTHPFHTGIVLSFTLKLGSDILQDS